MRVLVDLGVSSTHFVVGEDDSLTRISSALCKQYSLAGHQSDMWFQHKGRRIKDPATFRTAGIQDGATLIAHLRLRGGGGDGGATGAESRSSYLEMYMDKKPDKVNPAEEKLARATTCKLSGEKLQPPCVVDDLGSLYNKEAVISALVSKSIPQALSHISSLKHVREAKLTPMAEARTSSQADAASFQPGNDARFCCPISGQPLNGQYKFCAIFPSGHVVSEKALKQVPAALEELVGSKWQEHIPVNGTQEEVEALWDKLIAKRSAAKKSKKDRKLAIHAAGDGAAVVVEGRSSSGDSPTNTTENKLGKKRGKEDFGFQEPLKLKRVKASEMAPANADKKVWASLFTSSHAKDGKETYACRSTSARGWV